MKYYPCAILLIAVFTFIALIRFTSIHSESNMRQRLDTSYDAKVAAMWHKGVDLGIRDSTAGSVKLGMNRLKSLGFYPDRILDVGANVGDWARVMKDVFPLSTVHMIEASETCAKSLNTTGNIYAISLVGSANKMVDFYETPQGTGNSMFKERTVFFASIQPVRRQVYTIDTLMHDFAPVQFLKLDIQGAELDALKGAPILLASVQVILLELSMLAYNEGAPSALETLAFLSDIGFDMLDLIDFQYLSGSPFIGQTEVIVAKRDSELFRRRVEMSHARHPS